MRGADRWPACSPRWQATTEAPSRPRSSRSMGVPGLLLEEGDGTVSVVALSVDDGRIRAIDVIRNPDKLRHLAR
jgi:hypothetical protein